MANGLQKLSFNSDCLPNLKKIPLENTPSPILQVKSLTIAFGEREVVQDLSFQIAAGKTLAVVGESGSGKSLTALSIMGLLPADASVRGSIILESAGKPILLLNLEKSAWQTVRGGQAGLVFQEPMSALNPLISVGEQVAEAIRAHQILSTQESAAQALDWLRRVKLPLPEELYKRFPHQLSGGQKQRVIIAMALCNQPALLIADEPTTALDATVQQEIMLLLRELQQETGTALLFITHDLALAADIADDVLVLYRGQAVEQGAIESVFRQPQNAYTKALLQCRPAGRKKGERLPQVSDFLEDTVPEKLPVETVSKPLVIQSEEEKAATILLSVLGLTVQYEQRGGAPFVAVKDVSFNLHAGEVLGLIGESGCGKSTIAKALMGLAPVHEGNIALRGQNLHKLNAKAWKAVRRQMQIVFQDPAASLNPRITIGAAIMEPMLAHGLCKAREARTEMLRLLEIVGLPAESAARYPHSFSGGQKQRIGIARALSLKPQILICDESVSALDVSVQAQILNLLNDLKTQLGLSYIFISHDLNVVRYISDTVLVMQAGKIVEWGDSETVFGNPKNAYTQRLLDAVPAGI